MENKVQNDGFRYVYSAKEQEELKRIRSKYVPQEESKLDQLRRMDAAVTRKGNILSLVMGIIGVLIMGVGMCCCMVWGGVWFVPGIVIGILGIFLAAMAYPVYQRVTKKEREKIAPQILKLADELMK